MKIKSLLFLLLNIALLLPVQASFFQECKGLVSLLTPVESGDKGWLSAHFLMHKETFVCTGDAAIPKITGYRHEALQYMNLDIGKPTVGQLLRVSYRLSEAVTLGGGGFLNWGIEESANPTRISKNEKTIINKNLTNLKTYTYTGSYFSVSYPKNFIVQIEKPANYDAVGDQNFDPYDEAYFLSPDKQVEFFVFSPLWGGKPQSYLQTAVTEILVDEQTIKTVNTDQNDSKDHDQVITKRATLKAKNNSYFRSFVHIHKQSSDKSVRLAELDLVFGIKYKNKESYQKYKKAYIRFKKSLTQFSDE